MASASTEKLADLFLRDETAWLEANAESILAGRLYSKNWQKKILSRRLQLQGLIESGVLRAHAVEVLPKAYVRGLKHAVVETGLPKSSFPPECPYSLEEVLDGPMAE